jgi:predicted nucleic acid-binding Zn ribbon protein
MVLVAQQTVDATGHTIVTDVAVAATCTETGLTEGSHCSVCGETLAAQETIAATGHTIVTDAAVAATCTETGLTEGSHCSVCGETQTAQETVAALGHTIVTDEAVAATCTETGLTEGSHCSVCGEVLTAQETVAALGHTSGEAVRENMVDATCTAAGSYDEVVYCTACETQLSRSTIMIPVIAHTLTSHPYVAATTSRSGNYAYWSCDVCGKLFSDEAGTSETTEAAVTIARRVSTTTNVSTVVDTTTTGTTTGTTVETVEHEDGTTTKVETTASGTVTTTHTGTTVGVVTVAAPQQNVTAVVTLADDVAQAVAVVPTQATAGTVAVNADTGEILKLSAPTDAGLAVVVDQQVSLILVDKSQSFADVAEDYWGATAITFVAARELFHGTSETTFAPNDSMTRGMVMTVLARLAGVDTSTGDSWSEKGIAWAVENGISDGSDPEAPITREQFATMLWRYAGKPQATQTTLAFTDADQVSSYALSAMLWANENGIVNGCGDGTVAPQSFATRAQVAQMIMNYIASLAK